MDLGWAVSFSRVRLDTLTPALSLEGRGRKPQFQPARSIPSPLWGEGQGEGAGGCAPSRVRLAPYPGYVLDNRTV